jgi:hypothetical protein
VSLKGFHVVFVTLATLLALGFAAWSLSRGEHRALGVASLVVAVALPIYGWWFLAKTKDVSPW